MTPSSFPRSGVSIRPRALQGTKAGSRPASTAYLHHVLDAAGTTPRVLRSTRMLAMVNTLDLKLVAAALGLDAQAQLIYLADRVDPDRLPAANS